MRRERVGDALRERQQIVFLLRDDEHRAFGRVERLGEGLAVEGRRHLGLRSDGVDESCGATRCRAGRGWRRRGWGRGCRGSSVRHCVFSTPAPTVIGPNWSVKEPAGAGLPSIEASTALLPSGAGVVMPASAGGADASGRVPPGPMPVEDALHAQSKPAAKPPSKRFIGTLTPPRVRGNCTRKNRAVHGRQSFSPTKCGET